MKSDNIDLVLPSLLSFIDELGAALLSFNHFRLLNAVVDMVTFTSAPTHKKVYL